MLLSHLLISTSQSRVDETASNNSGAEERYTAVQLLRFFCYRAGMYLHLGKLWRSGEVKKYTARTD